MNWILDTNVISETNRTRPSSEVMEWMSTTPEEYLYTTVINFAELRYGIAATRDPDLANRLQCWLEKTVRPMFVGRTIFIDEDILVRWRSELAAAQTARRSTSPTDLLIAAAALHNGFGVATRDVQPFIGTSVPVLNPFTRERFNGA